jgi:hypothetical protein
MSLKALLFDSGATNNVPVSRDRLLRPSCLTASHPLYVPCRALVHCCLPMVLRYLF